LLSNYYTLNVLFAKSPKDLTGIKIAVDKLASSIAGEKWIILDSLRVLTIYNTQESVLRFLNSMRASANSKNAKFVVIASEGRDQMILRDAMQFVDEVVRGEKTGEEEQRRRKEWQ